MACPPLRVVVDGDPLRDIRILQQHDRLRVFKGGLTKDGLFA